MLYPKLCQSMIKAVFRKKQEADAIASEGMEGGFCEGSLVRMNPGHWETASTNLNKKPFRRFGTITQCPPQTNHLEKHLQRTEGQEKKLVACL